MKRVVLYFGSFNPIHRSHLAVADYVLENELCDELWFVVSPCNPYKVSSDLAPEDMRLLMARLAVAESKHPTRIVVCDVEFALPRPSYTINTMDHLRGAYPDCQFSLLIGGDNVKGFEGWKSWERLLSEYDILVYPRGEELTEDSRFRVLNDAPLLRYSSTEVRESVAADRPIGEMVTPAVESYIEAHPELWNRAEVLRDRGKRRFAEGDFGGAINDFRAVERLTGGDEEARQMADMANEILEFRYKDIYNP